MIRFLTWNTARKNNQTIRDALTEILGADPYDVVVLQEYLGKHLAPVFGAFEEIPCLPRGNIKWARIFL